MHPAVQVRHASLKVIQLILGQGLVHPIQVSTCIFSVASSVPDALQILTDPDPRIYYPKFWILIGEAQ